MGLLGGKKKCGACNGKGYYVWHHNSGGRRATRKRTCESCGGSGKERGH